MSRTLPDRLPPLNRKAPLHERAHDHAARASELLDGVDTREDEGPLYGSVRATSALAHAVLALFYREEADR